MTDITYLSLCRTCVTFGTLCHAIGHQVLFTQPLHREVENFPRGNKYCNHVSLLTYLIWKALFNGYLWPVTEH